MTKHKQLKASKRHKKLVKEANTAQHSQRRIREAKEDGE